MPISREALELFSRFYTNDDENLKSLSDEDRKNAAEFLVSCMQRDHYKNFEENAEQIASELEIIRKNLHALKVHHLTRHLNEHNIKELIEKVENKTYESKEKYVGYVAVLYDLQQLLPVFKDLERFEILKHHESLQVLYVEIQKSHHTILTLGLIDQDATPTKPGLFSENNNDVEPKSPVDHLVDLFGFADNDNLPKPK